MFAKLASFWTKEEPPKTETVADTSVKKEDSENPSTNPDGAKTPDEQDDVKIEENSSTYQPLITSLTSFLVFSFIHLFICFGLFSFTNFNKSFLQRNYCD